MVEEQSILATIATVLAAIAFVAIAWWAFAPKRKKRFEEASQLPFADENDPKQNEAAETSKAADKNEPQSTDDVARRN